MSPLLLSVKRLKKAIDRAGMLEDSLSVDVLCRVLKRRGMSERKIHALFFEIIRALEPPSCYMSHCRHFGGVGAPMNCGLERVPGRCSILREYKQRAEKRGAKSAAAPKEAAIAAVKLKLGVGN